MWIEAKDKVTIHQIFNQAYRMRNPDVGTINYIPGEVFNRMKEIESYCKLQKESNSSFKYQIRLGYTDLILKIKYRNTNWCEVALDHFGKLKDFQIPLYKGSNKREENSLAKGRKNKHGRSPSKSPILQSKRMNLRPEFMKHSKTVAETAETVEKDVPNTVTAGGMTI